MKDKEWLKEEVKSLFDEAYDSGKMEYYESEESIHRINNLVDQLDEPEVLNEEWINEHSKCYTMENSVEISDLKNLLLPQPKKPVIPQFVADWYESEGKRSSWWNWFYKWGRGEHRTDLETKTIRWMQDFNEELFVDMFRFGYEVEEEKLYTVKLSQPKGVFPHYKGDELFISKYAITTNSDWEYNFTEAEIKAIDERYWAFAEEVTE